VTGGCIHVTLLHFSPPNPSAGFKDHFEAGKERAKERKERDERKLLPQK